MNLRLTQAELRIIQHRLSMPDSIAVRMAEKYNEDEIYDVCVVLSERLREKNNEINTPLEADILAECLEGSTWFSDVPASSVQQKAQMRVAIRLQKKLSDLTGRKIELPSELS